VDESTFWGVIDRLDWKHEGDDEAVVAPLVAALASMPEAEIAAFHELLAQKLYELDGRAWARHAGSGIWWGEPDRLSADGFLYARCVVIANGRLFFEQVKRDPRQMPKDMEFESLLYVALRAMERRTGHQQVGNLETEVSFETFANRVGWES
jgi:hypothetical protein